MNTRSLRVVQGIVLLVALSAFPLLAHAQQADLQSTIRGVLLSDPRTAQMSQAQIDAMVALLSQKAQQKGLTPADIAWRPLPTAGSGGASSCAGFPEYLCTINESLGFDGSDYTIPAWLGVASLLLILLVAVDAERRRKMPVAQAATAVQGV